MSKVIPFQTKRRNDRAVPDHHQSGFALGSAVTRSSIFNLQSSICSGYNDSRVLGQIETIAQEGRPFLVGEWLVEPTLNRLTRGEATVQLELRVMDVLLCLAEHAGEVVAHHVLLDAVWQTEYVSDETLKNRIAELRRRSGTTRRNPATSRPSASAATG